MTEQSTGPQFELTNEDRLELSNLLQSKGWDLLVSKVWSPQATFMRELCCTNALDHRYNQGFIMAFDKPKPLRPGNPSRKRKSSISAPQANLT